PAAERHAGRAQDDPWGGVIRDQMTDVGHLTSDIRHPKKKGAGLRRPQEYSQSIKRERTTDDANALLRHSPRVACVSSIRGLGGWEVRMATGAGGSVHIYNLA